MLAKLAVVKHTALRAAARALAGTVLSLVFEVWDVAAEGGSGALLGSGKVTLPAVSKLKEREKQAADVELSQVSHCKRSPPLICVIWQGLPRWRQLWRDGSSMLLR